jgi:hypothetical protein
MQFNKRIFLTSSHLTDRQKDFSYIPKVGSTIIEHIEHERLITKNELKSNTLSEPSLYNITGNLDPLRCGGGSIVRTVTEDNYHNHVFVTLIRIYSLGQLKF